MQKIIVILIVVFTCHLPSFAMQVPIINQMADYSPIAEPIIANKHATAFPMGLGVAADNGDKLDFIIALENFTAPVDLYLGLYAPALDPGDVYLFTESGNIQGFKTAGLQPWKHKLTDSIFTTVLSNIPTNSLPYGTYTFYLLVTPADTLEPQWLWSTAFQHSDAIKGIFINTVKEDSLVMTAVDKNDLYYSFFGVKNETGDVQYFNQLILDQRDSAGDFKHYLSIDFDEYRRPVAIIMADAGGRMLLDYISETQVSVSILLDDGSTNVVVVDNPYPIVDTRYAEFQSDLSVETRDSLQRSSATDNDWYVIGEIATCKDGEIPKVRVKRELDDKLLAAAPQLALITPTVSADENGINGDVSYTYSLQGLPDYASWEKSCWWDWTGGNVIDTGKNILTGILGSVVTTADQLYQFGSGFFNDVKDGTVENTAANVVDHYVEGVVPIWTYLRKLYDLGKLPVDANNGPCSQQVWDYMNQVQTAEQTVTVTLKGITKQQSFIPKADLEDIASVYAPDFDFSGICGECGLINNWVFDDAFFGLGFNPQEGGYVVNKPEASNGLIFPSSPGTSLVASYSFKSWTSINLIIKSFENDGIARAEFEQERDRTDDWFSEGMYEWIGDDTYGYVYPGDHEEGLLDTATMIAVYKGNTIKIVDVGLSDLEVRSEIVQFYNTLLTHAKTLIDRKCGTD